MRNDILIEFQRPDGTWFNASPYRLDRDPVPITRGKSPSDKTAGASQANFTLKNPGGLFSLRNPSSPLYGVLKRNTPVRISKRVGSLGLVVNGNDRAFCGDSAALSFLGDMDLRIDLKPNSDWNASSMDLMSKFSFTVGQLGWSFITVGGFLRLAWWPTGTTPPTSSAQSSVKLPAGTDRRVLRVTLDVNNGAAGNTVTFYTGSDINGGAWTQLGAAVVQAGVTSLFDTPTVVRIGSAGATTADTHGHSEATIYAAQIRNGIGGTVVASPDFGAQPIDEASVLETTFLDAQGNSWGFTNNARLWYDDVRVRFYGETAAWPPRWNERHTNKHVPITANGSLRRYQQGKSPVATGLRDFVLSDQTALLSYFPLDGGEGTQYSRNIANTNRYVYNFYNEALPDKPLFKYGVDMGAAWIGTGMELERTNTTGWMRGDTVSWDSNVAFDFLWQSSSLGGLSISLRDYSGRIWTLDLNDITDSGLGQVSFTDPTTGPVGFATFAVPEINDTDMHIGRLQITNNGANTDYAVYVDGTLRKSGTQAGVNTNGSATFTIQYAHANTGQVAVNLAHLITWANASAAAIPTAAAVANAALGYTGEAAGRRIERVCDDGGIPIAFVGDLDDTTLMGPQYAEARIAQIRDAEATDFGILYEPRDAPGLAYRTRSSMYDLEPAVVLDYSARVIAPPFEPVDDDEATVNDVTATRRDGGSYQIARTTGPLSAADPPVGIGQYEDEITVNVETDAQLAGVAAWRLNAGTLDAARYPSLVVNLEALKQNIGSVAADTLIEQILAADIGDRMTVDNLSAANIPDDLDLLLLGYTETMSNTTWEWAANCGPYDLFDVAVFQQDKYDADGSVLTAAITAGATSFQVTQGGTSIWTRTPAAFPFDINVGGERMTVSNVTSATSPQTFTVTRAVNGVSTSHAAGTPVKLWATPRFAL